MCRCTNLLSESVESVDEINYSINLDKCNKSIILMIPIYD